MITLANIRPVSKEKLAYILGDIKPNSLLSGSVIETINNLAEGEGLELVLDDPKRLCNMKRSLAKYDVNVIGENKVHNKETRDLYTSFIVYKTKGVR